MPDAVPRNERAKERAAARDRTSVDHRDVGVGDRLGDASSLTERIALRSNRGTREHYPRGHSEKHCVHLGTPRFSWNGPLPLICTTVAPRACAKCGWRGGM